MDAHGKLARVSRRIFLSLSLLPPEIKKNTAGSRDYKVITPLPFLSYFSEVIRNYTTPGCNKCTSLTPHLSSVVIRNYTTPGCNKCFISVCSLQALNISYYINSQDKSMVSVVTWCPAQFSIHVFHTNQPTQFSHQLSTEITSIGQL